MGRRSGFIIALIGAALLALSALGCGGGSSSSSTTGGTSSSSESDQGEGSASFIVAGKKNTIVKFGEEADSAEREAASAVLEENLDAREAGKWSVQCASLSAGIIKGIEERGKFLGIKGGCGKDLEAEAEPVPPSVRANTMTGPIAALRVKGETAYALYHGAKGTDYAMKMEKEGGEWKVASLTTITLPKS